MPWLSSSRLLTDVGGRKESYRSKMFLLRKIVVRPATQEGQGKARLEKAKNVPSARGRFTKRGEVIIAQKTPTRTVLPGGGVLISLQRLCCQQQGASWSFMLAAVFKVSQGYRQCRVIRPRRGRLSSNSLAPYPSRLPNCTNRHPRHHRLMERRSLQGRQCRKGAKGQNTLQEVRSLILGSYRTPRHRVSAVTLA